MEKHKNKKAVNQCDLCSKTFANKYSFKHHMSDHLLDKAFEYPSCKKQFQSRSYFEQHIKEAHEDYTCHVCRKTFGLKQNLHRHQKTIHSLHLIKNLTCFGKDIKIKD